MGFCCGHRVRRKRRAQGQRRHLDGTSILGFAASWGAQEWALENPGTNLTSYPWRTLPCAVKPLATGFPQLERAPAPKSGSIFRVVHLPQLSAVGVERPGPLTPTAVQGPQLFKFPVELAEPSVETPLHLTCFFCTI